MRRLRSLCLFLGLLAGIQIAGCATTDAPSAPTTIPTHIDPAGKVTRSGLFEATRPGTLKDDPDSPTGKTLHNPVLDIVEETDRVPLRQGVYFGYRYHLQFPTDVHAVKLQRVLLHPPIVRPDGTTTTRSERALRKRVYRGFATGIDGYVLQEPYELVAGEWIFQLWYGERLLVEQRFQTEPE